MIRRPRILQRVEIEPAWKSMFGAQRGSIVALSLREVDKSEDWPDGVAVMARVRWDDGTFEELVSCYLTPERKDRP